jgi:membrane protein YdbS with pleckstrin-like domain
MAPDRGGFLRSIKQFRAIVDYAVIQDPFMRYCQIHALQMTTTGGGPTSTITITGVKECLKARDTLSEIDRMRENAP